MFEHPIIDVTLGLLFVYVVLSLLCSAIQEWLASVAALRSTNLETGIKNLVGSDLANAVYGHPLVKSLAKPNRLPSYISAETFSAALLEIVAKDRAGKSYSELSADELREMIRKIPDGNPLRDVLSALVGTAGDAVEGLKARVADWFDEGMERVSGWYKRRVKYLLLGIAAIVAVAANANTLHVVAVLWENDAARTAIAAQAQAAAASQDLPDLQQAREQLKDFPIGWNGDEDTNSGWWWLHSIFGWLLTMAAISLGAPFWFDLLGKVARLRASGGKPEPKKKQP